MKHNLFTHLFEPPIEMNRAKPFGPQPQELVRENVWRPNCSCSKPAEFAGTVPPPNPVRETKTS